MLNFLFSFLLPFLVVIAGLALRGAMPFGDGSLLAIDAWGQYYPMLCAMKEAVKAVNCSGHTKDCWVLICGRRMRITPTAYCGCRYICFRTGL